MTVAPSTVTSMYDLATELLAAVIAAMTGTEGGSPDRSFVSLGDPPWDTLCSYAVVQIPTLNEGQTGPSGPPEVTGIRHSRGSVNLVSMSAWAMRCISSGQNDAQAYAAPDDAQLSLEAKHAYEDGWAVWNYVKRAINAGTLFSGPCTIVHFDAGVAVNPSGGIGGWRFNTRVELNGYDPTA